MTKNEIRRIKKGNELIKLLLFELENQRDPKKFDPIFSYRDSFHHIFYDGNRIDELFLYLFPIKNLENISWALSILTSAYATMGSEIQSQRGRINKDDLIKMLNLISSILENAITSHSFKIFYSWQSDLENKTNRGFIEDALEKATKLVSDELNIPLILDKDTIDRTDSPDIANTILEKIDDCFIFVADISIINSLEVNQKKSPNPNVLFEAGYAQGGIGEQNIILILNSAFGNIDTLPFDLRGKRIMQYNCPSELNSEQINVEKLKLINHLKNAIKARCKAEML